MDSRPRTCFIHMDAGQISNSLVVAPPYLGSTQNTNCVLALLGSSCCDSQSQRGSRLQATSSRGARCGPYCR